MHVCAAGLCVWSHRFVYMYVAKNWLFEVLPVENLSLVQYTARLSNLTAKRRLLRQVIRSGKEIRRHSIKRMGKGFPENCITVNHTSSTYNAATCSYAMLLQLQCRPTCTISLQVQSVLTVLSTHRVCVLWNSSYKCFMSQCLPLLYMH